MKTNQYKYNRINILFSLTAVLLFPYISKAQLNVDASGRVGVVTATPSEKLDVTGNVRFSGALMPNNLAGTSGYFLKSNGTGASPTWVTAVTSVTASGNIASSGGATPNLTFTGILPIANGGTNNSGTIGSAGSVIYSNGTQYSYSGVGTSGQVLTSAGSGTPIWSTISGGAGWSITGNTGITNPAAPATYGTSTIGGSENWIGNTDARDIVYGTNNIERMRIKQTTGYVGIGKASPATKLDVYGTRAASSLGALGNGIINFGGDDVFLEAGAAPSGSYGIWFQAKKPSTSTAFPISLNPLGGYVGIGTASPGYSLDVVGNINVNTGTDAYQINGDKILWNNNITTDLFVGVNAGSSTTGANNTFMGNYAGNAATTGINNTALGYNALRVGNFSYNVAVGASSMSNISGAASYNTACGYATLAYTTSGANNTAAGYAALYSNTTGASNTGIGYRALNASTTGSGNTALGYNAGATYSTGSNNTYIGYGADANSTYTYAAAIGAGAVVGGNSRIQLGNTTTDVYQTNGHYYTSDGRFKNNVTENVKGLEFIKKLRPVTYNMDTKRLDDFLIQNMPDSIKTLHQQGMDFTPSTAIVHSGFIAQEVEIAATDAGFVGSIVHTPADGNDLYAISYAEIVVPLVKAVQELSKTADSTNDAVAKKDSINDAKLQNMQDQIDQLSNLLNACCNNNHSLQQNSNSNSTSSIDVNLKDGQTIVLDQNIPNPFAEQTTINYFLPDNVVKAQMLFYNAQGKLIQSVDLNEKGKGSLNVFANDLSNGIYTYTLVVDGKIIETKKMIKQK